MLKHIRTQSLIKCFCGKKRLGVRLRRAGFHGKVRRENRGWKRMELSLIFSDTNNVLKILKYKYRIGKSRDIPRENFSENVR